MPIKKIHVGFDIDMSVFMQMLVHGSSGVQFQAFGDEAKPKRIAKDKRLALAPPDSRPGAKNVIMAYLLKHRDRAIPNKELSKECSRVGYSDNTASPQLMWLRSRGLIKRTKNGYVATAKAVNHG